MTRLYTNNASTTLATAVNNTDDPVILSVAAGTGALFPALTEGDTYIIALQDSSGNIEYLEVTDRAGDLMTATRARDGSTISAFSIGDVCDLRLIAEDLNQFAQSGAPLDLGGNALSNADCDTTCTWTGGAMQAGFYAAQDGGASNAINVPDGGGAPNIAGTRILTTDDLGTGSPELDAFYNTIYPVGIVVLFNDSTDPNQAPGKPAGAVWAQLENAYDRYLRFSATPGTQFSVPGQRTGIDGAHQHGPAGRTLGHALSVQEMPSHRHTISYQASVPWLVTGGRGIDAGGSDVGVFEAPRTTGYTGGAGGVTQEHSHAIQADNGHSHLVDSQPDGYTLIPWLRTS